MREPRRTSLVEGRRLRRRSRAWMACLCVIYKDDTQMSENSQYIFFKKCFGMSGHPPLGCGKRTLLQFPQTAAAQKTELRPAFLRQKVASWPDVGPTGPYRCSEFVCQSCQKLLLCAVCANRANQRISNLSGIRGLRRNESLFLRHTIYSV